MDTVTVLEYLANNTHFRVDFLKVISKLPAEIQSAFLSNNTAHLKNHLAQDQILANRTTIFQI